MRTTITLDSDVEALLHKLMTERGISFKEAVNSTLRSSLASTGRAAFHTPTFAMGAPIVSIDRALALAADLEDAETKHELSVSR
jgi:hypothetical protein